MCRCLVSGLHSDWSTHLKVDLRAYVLRQLTGHPLRAFKIRRHPNLMICIDDLLDWLKARRRHSKLRTR
jgi:hypothetical protein